MAPAIEAVKVPSPSGRGGETHRVSPARARRCPVDQSVREQQRPAPDPAGEKRPPMAGRALAGGFGPPAGQGSGWHFGRGDGPCHCSDEGAFVSVAGIRKRDTRFPHPRATVPCSPVGPGRAEASARRGGAGTGRGLWPPGWTRISAALWQGRWPLPERPAIPKCAGTPLRAGKRDPRFPARAARCQPDRQVREERRPAPDPAGEKRPPGAGRALAGGFGPPAGQGPAWRCGRGDGPCH